MCVRNDTINFIIRQDSWWYEAHEKEMEVPHDDNGDWAPGPISEIMDAFHVYSDAIRSAHQEPEKGEELLAKVKAQYPKIEGDKPVDAYPPPPEDMPEDDEQQYEETTVDRIHGRACSDCSLSTKSCFPPDFSPFLLPHVRAIAVSV